MTFRCVGIVMLAGLGIACSDDDPVGVENGQVEVTTVTTGESMDDSYILTVNTDVLTTTLLANEAILLDMEEGTYDLELTDVADNCAIAGDNPVSVDIASGLQASVQFEVSCTLVDAEEG